MRTEAKQNLRTLALYLANGGSEQVKFEMEFFAADMAKENIRYGIFLSELVHYLDKGKNLCSTSACALGHGVLAGIRPESGLEVSWREYYSECFAPFNVSGEFEKSMNSKAYEFMFSERWPNDKLAAARRILITILCDAEPVPCRDMEKSDEFSTKEEIIAVLTQGQ